MRCLTADFLALAPVVGAIASDGPPSQPAVSSNSAVTWVEALQRVFCSPSPDSSEVLPFGLQRLATGELSYENGLLDRHRRLETKRRGKWKSVHFFDGLSLSAGGAAQNQPGW